MYQPLASQICLLSLQFIQTENMKFSKDELGRCKITLRSIGCKTTGNLKIPGLVIELQ